MERGYKNQNRNSINWRPKKTIQSISKIKGWFFGKINNIDKPLA
jgi:hypothetical protein